MPRTNCNSTLSKLLLTVTENRTYDKDDCCHTGGSIAWDKQGNLYLSTGDNTNPFYSNGFSPSDDRARPEEVQRPAFIQ